MSTNTEYESSPETTLIEALERIGFLETMLGKILKRTKQDGCITGEINKMVLGALYTYGHAKPMSPWSGVEKAVRATIGDVDERTKQRVISAAIGSAIAVRHDLLYKAQKACTEIAGRLAPKKKRTRKELLDELHAMTPEEGFQTLVDAGIYHADGALHENYGGEPRELTDQQKEIDRLKAELAKVTTERDALAAHSWHMGGEMVKRNPACACHACNPKAWWMVLCSTCGNKRCPHAENHIYECTNSNEPDQPRTTFGPISPETYANQLFEQSGGNLA